MKRTTCTILAVLLLCGAVRLHAQLLSPHVESGSIRIAKELLLDRVGAVRRAQDGMRMIMLRYPASSVEEQLAFDHARTDMRNGDFALADKALTGFILSHPRSPYAPFAHQARAAIAYERLDYQQSALFFASTAESAANNYMWRSDTSYTILQHYALFWQAISMIQTGRYDDALPVLETVSASTNGIYSDDALFWLGQIAELKNNNKAAITAFEQVRTLFPQRNTYTIATVRQAQNHLLLREAKDALSLLLNAETSLQQNPTQESNTKEIQTVPFDIREQVHFLRGECLNQLGQYEQARAEYKPVLVSSADPTLIHQARLGDCWSLLSLGKPTNAIDGYTMLIDSIPENSSRIRASALLFRAVAYKRSGQRDNAQREFVTLTTQHNFPYTSQVLLELGQIYYEDGKFDAARRILERAERESSEPVIACRVQLILGATHIEQQSWQRAIRSYQQAEILGRKATDVSVPQREQFIAEARLKRGVAYTQNTQYKDAITDLNAFIAEYPDDTRKDEAIFWLGEAFYRAELMKNAEESYEQIINAYTKSKRREEALYGLGWVYFRTQQFDKANDVFSRLINEFNQSRFAPDVFLRRGDALYLTKQYIEAAKSYKEAYKRSPKSDEGEYAQFQIGQALFRANDLTNSLTQLKQFLKNVPQSKLADDAQYTIAWIRTLQEKHDEAITEFEALVKNYPLSDLVPQAMYYIGNSFYNKGDYETAITKYRIVMESYPSSYYAHQSLKSLQDCLTELDRDDEAISVAKEYAEKNPTSKGGEDAQLSIPQLFLKKGDFKSAAREYQEFLKKYPESENSPEALYWLAKSQSGMDDFTSAEETYKLLLQKYPNNSNAQLGILEYALMKLYKQNDATSADSLFVRGIEKFPSAEIVPRAWYERAQIALSRNDSTRGISYFVKSAELMRGEYSFQAVYRLGMYYRATAKYDSARSMFGRLLQYDENPALGAEGMFRSGELWMFEKEWQKAAESFIIVKKKYDGQEDWYTLSLINLGECYERLNEIPLAREEYQTVIILHPADDYGKTAQSRLKRLGK
ncbi:MAG: tetratricopeptide repeat protein [Candidatus Kapabacteria bacterium]|nr:tetratricopeptide repeat protein [Candidatus Kapabacteria bacterium]